MDDSSYKTSCLDLVRQTMLTHKMVEKGNGVVLATSGGPDSVALAHMMIELREEFSCWFVIAHLDHSIRKESEQDLEFVKNLAKSLGIEFVGEKINVPGIASQKKISLEEAGRIARYDFLETVRFTCRASKIATAHNADDVVETFLLRIFQGSSLTGLCSIPFKRGNIIRPLLTLSRLEIIEFLACTEHGYIIDKTNLSLETERNFIRNRIVPAIREKFPNFKNPTLRTIELIQRDEQYLSSIANELYLGVVSKIEDLFQVDVKRINALPDTISSRIVRSILFSLSGPHTRWTRFHVDSILSALRVSKPFFRLTLPYGLLFTKDYGTASITSSKEQSIDGYCLDISEPGVVEIPDSNLVLEFSIFNRPFSGLSLKTNLDKVYFDADLICFPFCLRPFQAGDRIIPWGQNKPVKIKKLFIDTKTPRRLRRDLPLVVKENEIIWVPGVRRCTSYCVRPETEHILEISFSLKGVSPEPGVQSSGSM